VTLLDPTFLARLEALQLRTRRRLVGQLAGEHRSPRSGSSVDFADYRDYHPGDDFRRIDYHLLARLDVALVKLFEADEDVHLRLVIDTSASMATGGKLHQATRLAAALGFVALTGGDRVSLHAFPSTGEPFRFAGRHSVAHLFTALEALKPAGQTNFLAAVSSLLARPGPPGMTMVISDLMTQDWSLGIGRLPARGADVMVVHVLAPEDLDPPLEGDVELVDIERGMTVGVSLTADTVRSFRARATAWADEVSARCHHVGAAYLRLRSDDDLEALLLTGWRRAGALR
jgi:uncharacterized protein (DUF58 family)